MEYLFIALVVIGVLHFVWEGILAPSIRTYTRYELFRVRDELRMMRINLGDDMPVWTFKHMQNFINTAINRMHRIDLIVLWDAQTEIDNNPAIAEAIERDEDKLNREIEESNIKELYELKHTVYKVISIAFFANSGGWTIYILPIIWALTILKKIKLTIKGFLFLPVATLEKISPNRVVHHYS